MKRELIGSRAGKGSCGTDNQEAQEGIQSARTRTTACNSKHQRVYYSSRIITEVLTVGIIINFIMNNFLDCTVPRSKPRTEPSWKSCWLGVMIHTGNSWP